MLNGSTSRMRLTPSGSANMREVVVAPAVFDVSVELSAFEAPVNVFDVVVALSDDATAESFTVDVEGAAVGTAAARGAASGAADGNCATMPANTVG